MAYKTKFSKEEVVCDILIAKISKDIQASSNFIMEALDTNQKEVEGQLNLSQIKKICTGQLALDLENESMDKGDDLMWNNFDAALKAISS